jgi:hypothetical protein
VQPSELKDSIKIISDLFSDNTFLGRIYVIGQRVCPWQAVPANITLGWKSLPNVLKIRKIIFITLAPTAYLFKLFTTVNYGSRKNEVAQ